MIFPATSNPIPSGGNRIHGCSHNGIIYEFGANMTSGYDEAANFCWWTICGPQIKAVGYLHCKTTATTTAAAIPFIAEEPTVLPTFLFPSFPGYITE